MKEKRSMKYNFRELEPKWAKAWEEKGIYRAVDFDKRPKKYVLFEFPYPSGERLHIGHAFAFTGTDVLARFYRMKGYNVLCPMGWDAFGLPAENYAIKTGINPMITTAENIANARQQAKRWGLSVDWEREINTTDPKYYKWTQWIFLQWYKKGLAYKKEMPINWCPACKIGLANEEVVAGRCERCGAEVTRRRIKQWVVKITEYADRLIEGLGKTEFIEKVKAAQINWIGRSEGALIKFKLDLEGESFLEVFTTRPDTLYGATFMVVAPEHELVAGVLEGKIKVAEKDKGERIEEVRKYTERALKKSDMERTELSKEKTGVFSGVYAINPATGKRIPVWISDFVLGSYGTGAIMAVPAHDERDWEFAKKFGLPIIPVIKPEEEWDFEKKAYTEVERGVAVNSPEWNGLAPKEAIKRVIEWLEEKKIGKRSVSYHLRDWIFSRQHYWGEPIPIVFCEKCGEVPVPEEDLPIELPKVENYKPTETGESPLAAIEEWVKTTCPKCGGEAKRETDTMPNWAGSDWYFLRYIDPKNDQALIDLEKARYWLPVDIYVGGDEHNTLHLLYSRFTYQFLWDIGAVPREYPEPYVRRVSHGVILGPDGQRMSKSRGNVINPDEIVEGFGADALRLYLMFIGPFDYTLVWSQEGLEGCARFLRRIWSLFATAEIKEEASCPEVLERKLHQTIKKVSEDIEGMRFNTAIAALMELFNEMTKYKEKVWRKSFWEKFLLMLAPFAPFITEELWEKLGNNFSIHLERWPEFESELIVEEILIVAVQVNGKLRGVIKVNKEEAKDQNKVEEKAREEEKVARYLNGQEIKKVIYVPGKLINFVA